MYQMSGSPAFPMKASTTQKTEREKILPDNTLPSKFPSSSAQSHQVVRRYPSSSIRAEAYFRKTRWRASAPSSSSAEDSSSQSSCLLKEEYGRETIITLLSSSSYESHESANPRSEHGVVRKARLRAGRVFGIVSGWEEEGDTMKS